ncbi:MAG: LD-carboxypeptidase [Candidatus Pacearchaeota archaeon]
MVKIIKPKHLKEGDIIGVVSPSSTIKPFPRRLQRGLVALEKLGLKVKLGKYAVSSFRHTGGTSKQRAEDIMNFFKNDEIKAIICSTGGWNSNSVLPFLDFDLIKQNPKIFCGFSDITMLNLALYKKSNLITFNGPTILPTFGEYGGPDQFTIKWFKKALFETKPLGVLEFPKEYTEEILWWETEDNRKRKMKEASPPKCVYEGESEGILIGGNLNTICAMTGTEFFPDFSNAILFLEDEGESTSSTERNLVHLEQLGVFNKIKGLIYGRPFNLKIDSPEGKLFDILKDFGEKYKIPIIMDVDIGHTSPMITLPIGVKTRINSEKRIIEILENATE